MIAFATPKDTTIPTIASAVAQHRKKYDRLPRIGTVDQFLRHLQEIRYIADLLQGCAILLGTCAGDLGLGENFMHYADCSAHAWYKLKGATIIDAFGRGIKEKDFITPSCSGLEAYRGASVRPPAVISLERILDVQFDEPCIFLIRTLGIRIALTAFVESHGNHFEDTSVYGFIHGSLPTEWEDALELLWAAMLYAMLRPGVLDTSQHSFSDLILRETDLAADLFELVVRQLQDPLPDG